MNPNIVSFPARSPSPNRFQVKGCISASQEFSRVAYFRLALSFFWIELHMTYRSSYFKHTWFRLNLVQTDYCFTAYTIKNWWKAPEPTDFSERVLHTHIYSNPSNKSSLCVDPKGSYEHIAYSSSKNVVFTPIFLMNSDYDSWACLHVCQCQRSFWIILPTIAMCVSADSW